MITGRIPMSEDALILARRLRQIAVGESISYQDLSALIERDVQNAAHYCLRSALSKIRREDGAVFAAVRNLGLRRLSNAEKIPHAGRAIISAERKIRRGERELRTVNVDALNETERGQFYLQSCKFGAVKLALSAKVERRLEQVVARENAILSMQELEQIFGGAKRRLVAAENRRNVG